MLISRPKSVLAGSRGPAAVPRRDGGQVVPLIAVLIVVMGAIAFGVVTVGGVLIDRAVARSAADAAALAAAAGDDTDAAEVARANGADLVRVVRGGDEVEVTVEVGRTQARARARAVRTVVPPPGEVVTPSAVPRSGDAIP
ncbi:MAG: hypothetical protein JJE52_00790 [Acidimicrobiia bacterium]|nr:hypothetical protein [Acidimicrobiia bacterium]